MSTKSMQALTKMQRIKYAKTVHSRIQIKGLNLLKKSYTDYNKHWEENLTPKKAKAAAERQMSKM